MLVGGKRGARAASIALHRTSTAAVATACIMSGARSGMYLHARGNVCATPASVKRVHG